MRQEEAVKAIVMCYAVSNKGMDMVEMPKICEYDRNVVTIRACIHILATLSIFLLLYTPFFLISFVLKLYS